MFVCLCLWLYGIEAVYKEPPHVNIDVIMCLSMVCEFLCETEGCSGSDGDVVVFVCVCN